MLSVKIRCSSIEIYEGGRLTPKYVIGEPFPVAELFGLKEIYCGDGGNWKFKLKDVIQVEIQAERIVVQENKKSAVFCRLPARDSSAADKANWAKFERKMQKIGESLPQKNFNSFLQNSSPAKAKQNVRAGRSGTFGKTKSYLTVGAASKFNSIPWDDNNQKLRPNIDYQQPTRVSGGLLKKKLPLREELFSESEPEEELFADTEEIYASRDLDSDNETGTKLFTDRKRKRLKQKRTAKEEESDDEDLFDDSTMTTPSAATQRLVSPATNRTTESIGNTSKHIASPEYGENQYSRPKNQQQISTFFHSKSARSFQPQNLASATALVAAKTPPRPSTDSSARMASAVHLKKQRTSMKSSETWLTLSPAKKIRSPAEKQKQILFGNDNINMGFQSAFSGKKLSHSQGDDANDPIQNEDSPRRVNKTFARSSLNSHKGKDFLPHSHRKNNDRHYNYSLSYANNGKFDNDNVDDDGPPEPRFRGLCNLGNTCYQNVSLQMLCTCRDLMAKLRQYTADDTRKLTKSICTVYQMLQTTDPLKPAANPRPVKEAMDEKTDKFEGYEQRDAHEFLSDLIDFVHDELSETATNEVVAKGLVCDGKQDEDPTDAFCLEVQVCLRCNSCGYSR
jgi:Ubiquitin carboxyl-terminal hydrolase